MAFKDWFKQERIADRYPNIAFLLESIMEEAYRAGYEQGVTDGIVDEEMRRTNHD